MDMTGNDKVRPPGLRRQELKERTRQLILDELVTALASGDLASVTHASIARKLGLSRQTLYRYFPHQDALFEGLWAEVNRRLTTGSATLPTSEASLLKQIEELFPKLDEMAPLITVVQTTPQGRAMRRSVKERRAAAFLGAISDAARGLDETDKRLAAAVIQALVGGHAWIEMRDQWDLKGTEMAKACGWAIRVLLQDLRIRQGKPL